MSYCSQLKKSWGYETNVPRCEACRHFSVSVIVLTTDSLTRRTNHLCRLGGFTARPNACCDRWVGRDGTQVEPTVPPKPAPSASPENPARPFACTQCAKAFPASYQLAHHLRDTHK